MIELNPYVFIPDFGKRYKRIVDGLYVVADHPLKIKLRDKPKCACKGEYCSLSENGVLVLEVGFKWNGANFVPDRECNMISSAIHDVLCKPEFLKAYGYWKRQDIYADVMKAQGGGWFLSNWERTGCLIGQWWPW